MTNNNLAERFKRLLQTTKIAKSVHVMSDPVKPDEKIFLILQRFPGDTPDNHMVAGISLDKKAARKLYNDLALKIRYLEKMSIEKKGAEK